MLSKEKSLPLNTNSNSRHILSRIINNQTWACTAQTIDRTYRVYLGLFHVPHACRGVYIILDDLEGLLHILTRAHNHTTLELGVLSFFRVFFKQCACEGYFHCHVPYAWVIWPVYAGGTYLPQGASPQQPTSLRSPSACCYSVSWRTEHKEQDAIVEYSGMHYLRTFFLSSSEFGLSGMMKRNSFFLGTVAMVLLRLMDEAGWRRKRRRVELVTTRVAEAEVEQRDIAVFVDIIKVDSAVTNNNNNRGRLISSRCRHDTNTDLRDSLFADPNYLQCFVETSFSFSMDMFKPQNPSYHLCPVGLLNPAARLAGSSPRSSIPADQRRASPWIGNSC